MSAKCNFGALKFGGGFGLKVDTKIISRAHASDPASVLYDETGRAFITAETHAKYSRTRSDKDHSDCYMCLNTLSAGEAQRQFDEWYDFSGGYIFFNGTCFTEDSDDDGTRVIYYDALTDTVHTVAEAERYEREYNRLKKLYQYEEFTLDKKGDLIPAEDGDEVIAGLDWTGFPRYNMEPEECSKEVAMCRFQKGSCIYRYGDKFWTRGPVHARVTKWVVTMEWDTDVREVLTLEDGRIDMP